MAEEMKEHGVSHAEAKKIALDHLRENPAYYRIVDAALAANAPPKAEKYLMPDGSRVADEGIAEGRKEKDWQNISTSHYQAGGPGGVEVGGSSPAGPDSPEQYAKLPERHAATFSDQLLVRYYKASTDEAQERFWQGDEREIVVIQDEKPMRYSRKHGQVSVEYVHKEAT
jgi:hypothetical protein